MGAIFRTTMNRVMKNVGDVKKASKTTAGKMKALGKVSEDSIKDWIKKNGGTRKDALKALEKSLTKIG